MSRFICIVCVAVVSSAAWAGAPRFEGLGDLPGGGYFSAAYGISADGKVVVGQSFDASDSAPFRWLNGKMTHLGDLAGGSTDSAAFGTSANGSFVVGYSDSASGYQAFRWTNGTMNGLGDLPGGAFDSTAFNCSADGNVVVGTGVSASGYEAFRWAGGSMTGLGDLPGGGFDSAAAGVSANGLVICGTGLSSNGYEAFRWTNGIMTGLGDLPGGVFDSGAFGMSADGNVIVGRGSSAMGTEAFRWQNNIMLGLGDLSGGGEYSEAYACSSDGNVVVGYSFSGDGNDAFIWTPEYGMQQLYTVLTSIYFLYAETDLWQVIAATGVSADGRTICGYGLNPLGAIEGFRAVIPNPGTVAGHAYLQNIDESTSSEGIQIEVEVRDAGTLNIVDIQYPMLEDSGIWFYETSMRGDFDFAIKASHWLRKVVPFRTIDDFGSFSINAILVNGDVDGDNEVTLVDFGLLSSAFGSVEGDPNWLDGADLNVDGEVNLVDHAILSSTFGLAGDE